MDVPDFQELAKYSRWSVAQWSDAWLVLRDQVAPHQWEPVWQAVVALKQFGDPAETVKTIASVL